MGTRGWEGGRAEGQGAPEVAQEGKAVLESPCRGLQPRLKSSLVLSH